MANLIVVLAAHHDARRRLAAEPSLAPAAVEEALRWEAIAQFDLRVVRADGTDVAGRPAPAGTVVGMLSGRRTATRSGGSGPGSSSSSARRSSTSASAAARTRASACTSRGSRRSS